MVGLVSTSLVNCWSSLWVQPRGELSTPMAAPRAQQASRLLLMLGVRIL